MNKFVRILSFLILLNISSVTLSSIITTLNNNDPLPVFKSSFPYAYLYTNEKEYLKERATFCSPENISFSVSPFFQSANRGKNIDKKTAELGDLTGKWNMIAVLPFSTRHSNGTITEAPAPGFTFPTELTTIEGKLLDCISTVTNMAIDELSTITGLLSLQHPLELFGFFSVPIKYHKHGVRFEVQGRFRDFGFAVQTGVASISQVAMYIDQTTTPTSCFPVGCISTCPTNTNPAINCMNPFSTEKLTDGQWKQVVNCVHRELMDKLRNIAQATDISLCNFNKTSVEDLHIDLFWRRAFKVFGPRTNCISPFLFIPYATVGGTIAIAEKRNPDVILSVPFGNNGHNAFRFDAGFSLDFVDTIEVGVHAGVTHFFKKRFSDYRMPNNIFQNAFYPFKTSVEIEPGKNWHVGVYMNAYHFLDCLSFYGEFITLTHNRDKISLIQPNTDCNPCDNSQIITSPENSCSSGGSLFFADADDTVFRPDQLECKSPFSVQVFNASLYYDVSENFSLGYILQLPIGRRNAYRSTTHMLSLEMSY